MITNAQQSISYGLVNTVVTELLPPDTDGTAVFEDGSVRTYSPAASRVQKIPNLAALMNFPVAPGVPTAPAGSN